MSTLGEALNCEMKINKKTKNRGGDTEVQLQVAALHGEGECGGGGGDVQKTLKKKRIFKRIRTNCDLYYHKGHFFSLEVIFG